MKPISDRGWREQYDRMLRWQERVYRRSRHLADEEAQDDCYAFFTCCFHLKDWLKEDEKHLRGKVEQLFDKDTGVRVLCLCADLANGSKHMVVTQSPRFDKTSSVEELKIHSLSTTGVSRSPIRSVITVRLGETHHPVDQIVERSVDAWKVFLRAHGLLPETQ